MSENSSHSLRSDARLVGVFVVLNFAARMMAARLNRGEYTDGILQITQFENPSAFWPPLYTALVWLVERCGVGALWAGRLVSVLAGAALVPALWLLARAWSGRRAAFFALVLYTASAMTLRWSGRVMTDTLFACLFTWAVWLGLSLWRDLAEEPSRYGRRAIGLTVLAVAATLTRYQGLLVLPPLLVVIGLGWRRRISGRGAALAAQALWLLVAAWVAWGRFAHAGQVAARQAPDFWSTLLNYWYVFEMFLYLIPYALALPVFAFFVVGLVRGPLPDEDAARRTVPLRCFLGYAALAILSAQSAFQSFQTRYLLPLVPLALVVAGSAMARLETALAATPGKRSGLSRRLEALLIGGTVAWSAVFALAVVVLQAGAFGDIYEAGRFLAGSDAPAPGARVYSNETYAGGANGAKLAFASGRVVGLPPELEPERSGAAAAQAFGLQPPPDRMMEPGSVLAIHTAYGGPAGAQGLLGFLAQRYVLQPLDRNAAKALAHVGAQGIDPENLPPGFESWLIPLLPDIMEEPMTHQNPLAWLLRYRRQDFATWLFVVRAARPGDGSGG